MKDTFINFSKLKLNEAPVDPVTVERQGSEKAAAGSTGQREGTNKRREAQTFQMSAQTGQAKKDMETSTRVTEHLENINQEKELLKKYESQKSNWRSELSEALGPEPEEPEHPYVKVMPNIHYKQMEAEKELAAAMKPGAKRALRREETLSEKWAGEGDPEKKRRRDKDAATLKNLESKIKREGKKAQDASNKRQSAKNKGDKEKEAKYLQRFKKHTAKARSLKAKEAKLIPIGSTKYSKKSDASKMTSKYYRDLKSEKGRKEIAIRSQPTK